jgi:hypothetical protein
MATTKITSNVLALSAAQTNINNDGSFTLSVPTLINNTVALNGAISINTTSYTYGTGSAASHRTALGLDTLFAAKANLAGGNTFTGAQTISGASVTLQNAGAVAFSINETSNTEIPTFNLQQVGTTRGRIEGGVGVTSRMDFSVGSPLSRSMSLNQGGTQNYGVTIGRSSVAANVAPPTDGLHVQGNVGIGTATPNEKLTVVGNISATGNLTVDTNTLFVDSVNNNVGIGTTTPDNPLTVQFNSNSSALAGVKLLNSNGSGKALFTAINNAGVAVSVGVFGNSFGSGLANTATIASSTGVVIMSNGEVGSGGTDPISFRTGGYSVGAERMRIDSSGNVGIGTTTPNEKLTVVGSISATGNLTVDTNTLFVDSANNSVGVGTTSPTAGYILDVKGNGLIYNSSGATTLDIRAGSTQSSTVLQTWRDSSNTILSQMYPTGAMTTQGYALAGQSIISFGANILNFGTNTYWQNLNYGNASTIRHYFTGNVGIGTATPTYKLQLSGTSILGFDTSTSEPSIAGSASGISLKVSGGGASIFRGIDGWTGTWADLVPTTYFQVGRNFGNTMFSSNAGAQFNRLSFTVANTVNSGVVFTTQTGSLSAPDGYFEIRQGTTSNFLVARTTGNVGIGTATPNEKLTVVGNISATGIVTAEGNKLAAETFAIAMAIAIG